MQASPRVDVDEAPYAPGTDLLYVTKLEDAHGSIKLLKSDDNLEFFNTGNSADAQSLMKLLDNARDLFCVTCFPAQPIAGIITFQFEAGIIRNENQGRALSDAARIAGNG